MKVQRSGITIHLSESEIKQLVQEKKDVVFRDAPFNHTNAPLLSHLLEIAWNAAGNVGYESEYSPMDFVEPYVLDSTNP